MKQRVAPRANAGRGRRKLERECGLGRGPQAGWFGVNPVRGPMAMLGPLLDPHNPLIAVTQRRGRAAPNRAVAA